MKNKKNKTKKKIETTERAKKKKKPRKRISRSPDASHSEDVDPTADDPAETSIFPATPSKTKQKTHGSLGSIATSVEAVPTPSKKIRRTPKKKRDRTPSPKALDNPDDDEEDNFMTDDAEIVKPHDGKPHRTKRKVVFDDDVSDGKDSGHLVFIIFDHVDYLPSEDEVENEDDDMDSAPSNKSKKNKSKKMKAPPRISATGSQAHKPRQATRDPHSLIGDDTFRKQVDELKFREEKGGSKLLFNYKFILNFRTNSGVC